MKPGDPVSLVSDDGITASYIVNGMRFDLPVRYRLVRMVGNGAFGIVWWVRSLAIPLTGLASPRARSVESRASVARAAPEWT
jgi:hypothetical protein